MKFIEQQLVVALIETPQETECFLSAALLSSIGLSGESAQATWLERHRPARAGKCWRCVDERWEYAPAPVQVVALPPRNALSAPNWRTAPVNTGNRPVRIVVKPLPPLTPQA